MSKITFSKEEVIKPKETRSSGFASNLSSLLKPKLEQKQELTARSMSDISDQDLETAPSNSLVSSHSFKQEAEALAPLPTGGLPFECDFYIPINDEVEVAKVRVFVSKPQSITHLRVEALKKCYNLTEDKVASMLPTSGICAADDEGNRDTDCPGVSPNLPIHQLGLSAFLLLLSPDTPVYSFTKKVTPIDIYLGPKSKPIKNPQGRFFQAAETGDFTQLRSLHSSGAADIHAPGIDNWRALHFAARKGHLPVIAYLLRCSADVNCVTKNGWTPLHLACYQGQLAVIETLLAGDADINPVDKRGKTPLYYALTESKSEEVIAYMREEGGAETPQEKKSSS